MGSQRRLGGWERAFVVTCLATFAVVALDRVNALPSPAEEGRRVYRCDESLINLREPVRPAQAAQLVYRETFANTVSSDCLDALTQIADGRAQAEEWRQWRKRSGENVSFAVAFLACIYVAGLAVGWVWRGFFPKK